MKTPNKRKGTGTGRGKIEFELNKEDWEKLEMLIIYWGLLNPGQVFRKLLRDELIELEQE